MTLAICHRATCDAPNCHAAFVSPHPQRSAVRRQLTANGWLIFSWRVPQIDPVHRVDLGGAVCNYYVCPRHARWRPARGVECPLRRIAEPKR